MVSYLPVPNTLGEMKTKPTQSAVRELNSYGVQPDFIIARSNQPGRQAQGEARHLVQRASGPRHLCTGR
jgi:CTP synthase (UTP-ammonia lyase)